MNPSIQLSKPVIVSADEAWLRAVDPAAVLVQEKSDGQWTKGGLAIGPHRLNAEKMNLKDHAPRYVVNDVLVADGQDIRRRPFAERWAEAQRLAPSFPDGVTLCRSNSEFGIRNSEFFREIIERGGEGVVVKDLSAAFGDGAVKVKRHQVFYCMVIGMDGLTGGVELGLIGETFNPQLPTPNSQLPNCGKLPLRGGKFEQVRRGSVLKVEAYGLTAQGQLREARPDHDTPTSWLVRF